MQKESEVIMSCLKQCREWHDSPHYTLDNVIAFMHGMRVTLLHAFIDVNDVDKLYQEYCAERRESNDQ